VRHFAWQPAGIHISERGSTVRVRQRALQKSRKPDDKDRKVRVRRTFELADLQPTLEWM
jgi:hypothetical protein